MLSKQHFNRTQRTSFIFVAALRWCDNSTRRFVLVLSALIVCCFPAQAQLDALDDEARMSMQSTLNEYVRPRYRELNAAAGNLENALRYLCEDPSQARLDSVRKTFAALVTKWGEIEMFRFGPILAENRLERFLFHPDRKGRGLKQVQALLATKDQSAVRLETLQQKSVALQGLGALEYVLFGRGSDGLSAGENDYRCLYAHVVSRNLVDIAQQLDEGWSGDADLHRQWTEFGAQNPNFTDGREALSHLLSTIVHGLETARNVRLAAFLKPTPDRDRPRSAILWRSKSTLPILRANIRSMAALFDQSQLVNALPEDVRDKISRDIRHQFSALHATEIDGAVAHILADDNQRSRLVEIDRQLEKLIATFYGRYAQAVGLRVGFFFDDGD